MLSCEDLSIEYISSAQKLGMQVAEDPLLKSMNSAFSVTDEIWGS